MNAVMRRIMALSRFRTIAPSSIVATDGITIILARDGTIIISKSAAPNPPLPPPVTYLTDDGGVTLTDDAFTLLLAE